MDRHRFSFIRQYAFFELHKTDLANRGNIGICCLHIDCNKIHGLVFLSLPTNVLGMSCGEAALGLILSPGRHSIPLLSAYSAGAGMNSNGIVASKLPAALPE